MTVLPEVPSFGTQLARGLGAGLSQGISSGTQLAQQMMLEQAKMRLRQKLAHSIEEGEERTAPREEIQKQLLGERVKTPNQSEQLFLKAKKYASAGLHDEAQIAAQEARAAEKSEQTARVEKQRQHFSIAKDPLVAANKTASEITQKEGSLAGMEEAIKSGNLGFFSRDNLAEYTGIEGFRSPEGAAFKTQIKEFLLGNMGRVGARGLNQWLERQIADMAPKIGRSTEANLVVTEILKAELDVQRKQVELTQNIAKEMEDKYGYVRRELGPEVEKRLSKYAVERQHETKREIERIKAQYENVNASGYLMRDPAGNLRRVSKEDLKGAIDAGYKKEK